MADGLRELFRNEIIIVHELDDMGRLDDAFARKLEWPAGIKGQIFASGAPIPEELVLAPRFTYSRNLEFHINLSVRKEWLQRGVSSGSQVEQVADLPWEELRELYIRIKHRIFSQLPWHKADPEEDRRDVEAFEKKHGAYKVGCWKKAGAPAGIIGVRKWKDYLQQPVDWVSWVLVEESLPKEDRIAVRALIGSWLYDNAGDRVECIVQSFNIRSLKFFLKLGFKPVSIHVYKGE